MQIVLGVVPDTLVLNLSYGSPFVASLQNSVNWPNGTVIELRIGAVIWPATISGRNASWSKDVTAVNAVAHAGLASLYLNGELWAAGNVVRSA